MEMAVKGIKTDFDKFERLKAEHWEQVSAGVWACKKHKTYFNPDEEPCWQCVNECMGEL